MLSECSHFITLQLCAFLSLSLMFCAPQCNLTVHGNGKSFYFKQRTAMCAAVGIEEANCALRQESVPWENLKRATTIFPITRIRMIGWLHMLRCHKYCGDGSNSFFGVRSHLRKVGWWVRVWWGAATWVHVKRFNSLQVSTFHPISTILEKSDAAAIAWPVGYIKTSDVKAGQSS